MAFIYSLSHPNTGEIRYIGKTGQSIAKRMIGHKYHSKGMNTPINCWLRSLFEQDLEPVIDILETCHKDDIDRLEILYIKYGKELYNLLNLTDGGTGGKTRGNTGMKHSEETKRKIGRANSGHIHTEETKRKISNSTTGIPKPKWSKESRKNFSDYRKSNPSIRDTNTGRFIGNNK
jgi:group I intron endonuclease